jgi:7-alpha-hydroxysteroid dehydrogenase
MNAMALDAFADFRTGRVGSPEDAANALLYFCSPGTKWVSGQIVNVHGGGSVVRPIG